MGVETIFTQKFQNFTINYKEMAWKNMKHYVLKKKKNETCTALDFDCFYCPHL